MPFVFIWLLLEIAVFIWVGEVIGVAWTLALIVITTILGLIILRNQSLVMLKKMHRAMREGKPMVFINKETPIIMLAGILLLIPGFITDVIGLILLVSALPALFSNRGVHLDNKSKGNQRAGGRTIEGEFWREDKNKKINKDKN